MSVHRGEVWLVNLGNGCGSEQRGVRPCVIVQNDIGNKQSPNTIICPLTSKNKGYSATHFEINNLGIPSYILCEQIRVVSKKRLIKYIHTLSDWQVDGLNKTLNLTLTT